MKSLFSKSFMLFFVIVLVMMIAPAAHASEFTNSIPTDAVEALGLLGSLLAAWLGGGRLGNYLTGVVKKWTWIPEENRSKLAGAWAGLVAITLTSLSSTAIAYLTPLAEWLNDTGLWGVLVASVFVAEKLYLEQKRGSG